MEEEKGDAKGQTSLTAFIVVSLLMFGFFLFDLSLTYFVIHGVQVPVINLLPALGTSLA